MVTTRVAVLMTSFNRRELTLAALASLFGQVDIDWVDMTVFLVDDASRDGTSAAVAERFPQVQLLHGDGTLFWNGGMRRAFAEAMRIGFDAYIWFNDDTSLMPDALHRLIECAEQTRETLGPAIIVASVCDGPGGGHSYGGFVKKVNGLRMDFLPLPPDDTKPLRCDTMNGNFTLIPKEIADRLGNLEARFRHQIGDFDYGLRASTLGYPILVAPGYFGFCSDNSQAGTWRDLSLPLAKRWKNLMSPKGAPPREWLLYTRRHFGWRWPLYAISPYMKTLFRLQ